MTPLPQDDVEALHSMESAQGIGCPLCEFQHTTAMGSLLGLDGLLSVLCTEG